MGILVRKSGGEPVTLVAHCLVGRSAACTLRLDDARVSAEHARITWREERWEVRDLGSRNGTFVNEVKLPPGGVAVLAEGDLIGFGDAAMVYRLIDASPPVAMARRLDTGTVTQAQGSILLLPSEEEPLFCVIEGAGSQWTAESQGESRPAQDREVVTVAGVSYMLHLPVQEVSTLASADQRGQRLEDIELCFHVSRNEEQVGISVRIGNAVQMLAPRAHYYTLLVLARIRLRDEEKATEPEALRGWLGMDELRPMLAADDNRLNVDIFRIRRDIAALGVQNAATVIERRRGLVRIGMSRLAVEYRDHLGS